MASLNQRIQHFYDHSTDLWLEMWGEHMHHGFYGKNGEVKKNHQQAQLDLVEELLSFGQIETPQRILDVGCGVGGSARYLAKKYNAAVLGLTLSPIQVERGKAYNAAQGLSGQVELRVQDMMLLPPDTPSFDLIWSMESAEHIKNKKAMFEHFYRLLKPGGKILMATWCHRPEPPVLSDHEEALLNKIYRLYHLPPMCSIPGLQQFAQQAGFTTLETKNWSAAVAPFWKAVIQSALSWQGVKGLMKSGWPTIKGAWAMRYMTKGFKQGVIEFGVLTGTKAS